MAAFDNGTVRGISVFVLGRCAVCFIKSISSQVSDASSFLRMPVSKAIVMIVRSSTDPVVFGMATNFGPGNPPVATARFSRLTDLGGRQPSWKSDVPQSIDAVLRIRLSRLIMDDG